jgi:hypothetical protein
MAYLYRHIRLDKQEVFYVGIGSDEKYERAYSKDSRTQYWRSISKLGYEVEIVLDDLTWEEACEKEKEFIKLYGRKDLKEGTLVNMTDGGEGTVGFKHSEETKVKCREAAKAQESNTPGTEKYERVRKLHSELSRGERNPCYGKFGEAHPRFGGKAPWLTGKNNPRRTKVEYKGQVYDSKTELARAIGKSNSLITKMIKKKEVQELK